MDNILTRILACRPRNRGDSINAVPTSLRSSLSWEEDGTFIYNNSGSSNLKNPRHIREDEEDLHEPENLDSPPIHEWGAVEIDSNIPLHAIPEFDEPGSDSTSARSINSFSFRSRSMELLETYLENSRHRAMSLGVEIQPSSSLDKSMLLDIKSEANINSDTAKPNEEPLSTNNLCNSLRLMMNAYDTEAFTGPKEPKKELGSSSGASLSMHKGQFKR